jgi:hypothetical protein
VVKPPIRSRLLLALALVQLLPLLLQWLHHRLRLLLACLCQPQNLGWVG